jgi:hypothetical protein
MITNFGKNYIFNNSCHVHLLFSANWQLFPKKNKAFALTGRQACIHYYPGRCPGLEASALSGRVGKYLRKFSIVMKRREGI